nr:hypothetical protein ORFy [Bat coronavirus]
MDPAFGNALAANVLLNICQQMHTDIHQHGFHVSGSPHCRAVAWCLARLSEDFDVPDGTPFIYILCHRPYLLLRAALELEVTVVNLRTLLIMVRTVMQYDTSRTATHGMYVAMAAYFHRFPADFNFQFLLSEDRNWPLHIRCDLARETTV